MRKGFSFWFGWLLIIAGVAGAVYFGVTVADYYTKYKLELPKTEFGRVVSEHRAVAVAMFFISFMAFTAGAVRTSRTR
jgi:hypothetical protein